MKLRKLSFLLFVALLARGAIAAEPSSQSIILASTTSVENSGLLAHILPIFTKETGITVHVLAQGTGQALETAARDDADLVLVHDPEAEQKFIAAGQPAPQSIILASTTSVENSGLLAHILPAFTKETARSGSRNGSGA